MATIQPLYSACPWCGRRRHRSRCSRWFDAHPLEREINNARLRQGRRPKPRLLPEEHHHPRLSPARAARARVLRTALDTAVLRGEDFTPMVKEMRELLEEQV